MFDFAIGRNAHTQEPSVSWSTMQRLLPSGAQSSKIEQVCCSANEGSGNACAKSELNAALNAERREIVDASSRVRSSNRVPSMAGPIQQYQTSRRLAIDSAAIEIYELCSSRTSLPLHSKSASVWQKYPENPDGWACVR